MEITGGRQGQFARSGDCRAKSRMRWSGSECAVMLLAPIWDRHFHNSRRNHPCRQKARSLILTAIMLHAVKILRPGIRILQAFRFRQRHKRGCTMDSSRFTTALLRFA